MGFNIGPRVIRATGGSISRQGRKVIHHFPPQHVTDGLQLHIDVGDKRCLGSWDDGTDINDLSGHNRTMTRSGGQLWNSYAGGTWDFDGSNDEIYIRDGSLSKGIGKHFTYELWHRCDTNNTRQGLLSTHRSQGGSHQDAVEIEIAANNNYMLGFRYAASGTAFIPINGPACTFNSWEHLVIMCDGRRTAFYVNGTYRGENTGWPDDTTIAPVTEGWLTIGRYSGAYYSGQMGPIRVYNRALSADEVSQNYNADFGRLHKTADPSFTFTPTCSGGGGKIELLLAGAGGVGGSDVGGGGAGGRVIYDSGLSVTSGVGIAVTVGCNPTDNFGSGSNIHGANGTDTKFGNSYTVLGGNGGYGRSGGKSYAGWNGGGGSYNGTTGVTPDGAGGEKGYKGGDTDGGGTNNCGCGGGAGAGGVGGDGVASNGHGGHGGTGLAYNISGTTEYYGSGGGGSYYNSGGSRGYGGNSMGGDGGTLSSGGGSGRLSANSGRHGYGAGGGGGYSTSNNYNSGSGGHGCAIVSYSAEDYNIELLVVAGGGSGGGGSVWGYSGGGGGAGGVIYHSSLTIEAGKNYIVQAGAGGAAASGSSTTSAPSGDAGNHGQNSRFGDYVAIGGGGGGRGLAYTSNTAGSGGSGGGGGGRGGRIGSGTAGQGFDGGNSDEHGDVGTYGAGGGGATGAGGEGDQMSTDNEGDGGPGIIYSITGSSVTYANGGNAGNGASNSYVAGSGGGGGAGGNGTGSAGRNGCVLIAYKGPQRGTGGTIDTTSRPGYTIHVFGSKVASTTASEIGPRLFIA